MKKEIKEALHLTDREKVYLLGLKGVADELYYLVVACTEDHHSIPDQLVRTKVLALIARLKGINKGLVHVKEEFKDDQKRFPF